MDEGEAKICHRDPGPSRGASDLSTSGSLSTSTTPTCSHTRTDNWLDPFWLIFQTVLMRGSFRARRPSAIGWRWDGERPEINYLTWRAMKSVYSPPSLAQFFLFSVRFTSTFCVVARASRFHFCVRSSVRVLLLWFWLRYCIQIINSLQVVKEYMEAVVRAFYFIFCFASICEIVSNSSFRLIERG